MLDYKRLRNFPPRKHPFLIKTVSYERGFPVIGWPTLERGRARRRMSGEGGSRAHFYRGALLIRKRTPIGPFSRTMPRGVLGGS